MCIRDRFDTFRVFAGGGAGALQSYLPGNYLLQRQVDLAAEIADQGDCAALDVYKRQTVTSRGRQGRSEIVHGPG